MRLEIRQADSRKGCPEDAPNGAGIGPVLSAQTLNNKAASMVGPHQCLRKKGIVRTEKLFCCQMPPPAIDDLCNVITDRVEERLNRLAEFSIHLARVLKHVAALDRDMLELQADDSGIAHARKQKQRHQRSIT